MSTSCRCNATRNVRLDVTIDQLSYCKDIAVTGFFDQGFHVKLVVQQARCGLGLLLGTLVVVGRCVYPPPHRFPEFLLNLFCIFIFLIQHIDCTLPLLVRVVWIDLALVEKQSDYVQV